MTQNYAKAHGEIACLWKNNNICNSKLFNYTQTTLTIAFHFMSLWWKWNHSLIGAQELSLLWTIHACMRLMVKKFSTPKWWLPRSHVLNKVLWLQKKTMTYYTCSLGIIQCDECVARHFFEVENARCNPWLNSVMERTPPMGLWATCFFLIFYLGTYSKHHVIHILCIENNYVVDYQWERCL
jgi:hypothetical protein